MAGEFNVSGLVNNFDMNSILQQIQLLKSQQIFSLQAKQEVLNDKKGIISNIQSIVKNIQDTLSNLVDSSVINAKSVTVSDTNILNATITDSTKVQEGSYNVNIVQLAQNQVYASTAAIMDKNVALGLNSGTLTIHMNGNDYNIIYDSTFSLQALADQINLVATTYNGDFRASIINVGTSSSPNYRLVISGTKTGADNSFLISDTGNASSILGISSIQNAQNAVATVNGIQIESNTNTFTNIEGLSIAASQTGSTTLNITKDTNPLINNLNSLVNYYNQLVDTITKETGKDGKLKGEYTLNIITSGIFRQLDPLFEKDIINFDRTTGHISLNSSKLNDYVNNNPTELKDMLNQVKTNLTDFLTPYIQYNGIFDQQNKAYDQQIKSLQNMIDLQTQKVQIEIEILKNQFIKMQMLQAQLNDISSRITATFGYNNK